MSDGVAIVAGGSADLAAGIARLLALHCQVVVLFDDKSAAPWSIGEAYAAHGVDLKDAEALTACLAEMCERYGKIDCLVQIAPGAPSRSFLDATLADFDAIVGENLTMAFVLAQAVATSMAATGGGSIVFVADETALEPQAGQAIFGASQAAIAQLVRILAVDLSAAAIRVNALIAPIGGDRRRQAGVRAVPITAAAEVNDGDIAAAALFLSSSDASYINGHLLEATARPQEQSLLAHGWISGHDPIAYRAAGG